MQEMNYMFQHGWVDVWTPQGLQTLVYLHLIEAAQHFLCSDIWAAKQIPLFRKQRWYMFFIPDIGTQRSA